MINPFSALTSKIYGGIAIAALTFGAIQTVRIDGMFFIDGYVDKLAARDKTIKDMEKASKEATAAQIALNKAVTNKQADIARKADNDETYRRDIADRSSGYASRMSAQGYCKQTDSPSESSDTESGIRPGADAVMVSRSDFDILTGNTARLLDVKSWGDALIQEGLAVPVETK